MVHMVPGMFKCADGNTGGTALAHLPPGKFGVFSRLWESASDPFCSTSLSWGFTYVFTKVDNH